MKRAPALITLPVLLLSLAACNIESEAPALEESSPAHLNSNIGEFNFETRTVLLNSGYEMPVYGLGTYSLHGDECINSVT